MPIRLNLLTEALAEEDLRRRDPVKRVAYVGAFLVALSLVWFSSAWLNYKLAQSKLSLVEDKIQTQTNEFNRVQADFKKLAENQRRLAALEQLSTNRFLQGNLMNALQKIYVPNVQLIRVRLDQTYALKEGTPPPAAGSGAAKATAASTTEKITLNLDARDSGANPGDLVNRFKDSVAKLDFFKTNLQTNGIRLSNLSSAQTSISGKTFVPFSLECRFNDNTR
jgi:hypothetical protein